jgi:tryptophanyl-tRNA synthetase
MRRWLSDPTLLDSVLREGARKANAIAEPVLADVRNIVGFWR